MRLFERLSNSVCLVFSRDWVNSILFSSLSFLPSLDRKHEGLAEMLLKQEFLWKNFQRGERRRRKSFDSLIHVLFSRSLLHYVYSLSLTSMIPFRVSWQITWCHYYFWDFCNIVYPLHCFSFPYFSMGRNHAKIACQMIISVFSKMTT